MNSPAPDPSDPDRIITVENGPEVEEIFKGSRFIGQVFRALDPDSTVSDLETVRERYSDATHHCWAYRIGDPENARTRCDDDGEPGRTAGAPILLAIEGAAVSDLLVVVTRYFGGTKLGKGGLIRAYGATARAAIAAAPRAESFRRDRIRVGVAYDDLGAVESCLARHVAAIFEVSREFESDPVLLVEVRRSVASTLIQELVDVTGGRATVEKHEPERS